jgi:hypothetical protein
MPFKPVVSPGGSEWVRGFMPSLTPAQERVLVVWLRRRSSRLVGREPVVDRDPGDESAVA